MPVASGEAGNLQRALRRLKIFSEESVPLFGPPLPSPPVFADHQEFRDFLLVKCKCCFEVFLQLVLRQKTFFRFSGCCVSTCAAQASFPCHVLSVSVRSVFSFLRCVPLPGVLLCPCPASRALRPGFRGASVSGVRAQGGDHHRLVVLSPGVRDRSATKDSSYPWL